LAFWAKYDEKEELWPMKFEDTSGIPTAEHGMSTYQILPSGNLT